MKKMNEDTLKMVQESRRYFAGTSLLKEEFDPANDIDNSAVVDDPTNLPGLPDQSNENISTNEIKDFSDEVSAVLECEEEDLDEVFGALADSLEEALGNGETKIIVNIQDVLDLLNGYIEE